MLAGLAGITVLKQAVAAGGDLAGLALAAAARAADFALGGAISRATTGDAGHVLLADVGRGTLAAVAREADRREQVATDAWRAAVGARGGGKGSGAAGALGIAVAFDGGAFAGHTGAAIAAAEEARRAAARAADRRALCVCRTDARSTFSGVGAGGTSAKAANAADRVALALGVGTQRDVFAISSGLALAESSTLARGDVGGVVAADVVDGARHGFAAQVAGWGFFAMPGGAAGLTWAVTGGVATDAGSTFGRDHAMAFGAVGVGRARFAEAGLAGDEARARAIARAGAGLAGRAGGFGQHRAVRIEFAGAKGVAVEGELTRIELATLGVDTRALEGSAGVVARGGRARADAARHVAGRARLGARGRAADAVHALPRRIALRAGGAGGAEGAGCNAVAGCQKQGVCDARFPGARRRSGVAARSRRVRFQLLSVGGAAAADTIGKRSLLSGTARQHDGYGDQPERNSAYHCFSCHFAPLPDAVRPLASGAAFAVPKRNAHSKDRADLHWAICSAVPALDASEPIPDLLRNRGLRPVDGLRCTDGGYSAGRLLRLGAQGLVRILAPDYCAACDAPLMDAAVFCAECGPCPAAPDSLPLEAIVAGEYAPPLSTAILRLKFGQRTDLADRLSVLLPPRADRTGGVGGAGSAAPGALGRARVQSARAARAALVSHARSRARDSVRAGVCFRAGATRRTRRGCRGRRAFGMWWGPSLPTRAPQGVTRS